jgi:glutathione S-transferase
MKLFWGPHTCAIGIHVLLEEIGMPYETAKLDVAGGEAQSAEFLKINPKGKVPTLVRDDGSVLTEFSAIATWLARTHPAANLLPEEPEIEARASEAMDYVEGTIHGQGFARIFKAERFAPFDHANDNPDIAQEAIKQQGREIVERGFAILDRTLAHYSFAAGPAMTVADAALFYVERWAPGVGIAMPKNVQAHFDQMRERPAVRRVMELWGEA